MLNERLAQLVARKLSGEATDVELEELHQYLQEHPDDQYFVELLSTYWTNQHFKDDQGIALNEQFEHIIELAESERPLPVITETRSRSLFSLGKTLAAAAVIGLIVFVYFLFNNNRHSSIQAQQIAPVQKNELVAKPGARSHLLLPDGSQVWLNSASKLTYGQVFSDSIREVELEGEAFFEVAKDIHRPFIVHTSGIDIHVLGTAFNVKSYPSESTIETVLLRGTIEVINKSSPGSRSLIMKPHEKMIFNKRENSFSRTDDAIGSAPVGKKPIAAPLVTTIPKNIADTSVIETAWVYNKLRFEGDNFQEVAKKMERWYDVRIVFENDRVTNYRFGGSFMNESIQQALDALKLIHSFDYKMEKNEIRIF